MFDLTRNVDGRMLIDGERVSAGEVFTVCNPAAPGQAVGVIGLASPDQVVSAIAAAKQAQRAWGRQSFAARARALNVALDTIESIAGSLVPLYVRENGRTLKEAEVELASIVPNQRKALQLADALDEQVRMEREPGFTSLRQTPYGVVVSIVPWNAPAALAFLHVIPALLAGNAIVVKPPESCPLTVLELLHALSQCLPKGLVNVVTGLPEVIGPTLTTHPDVGKIAFTGGAASAARIAAAAAATIKSLTLELGGNDPGIILPGTPLDDGMLMALRRSIFTNTGQVCMAIKRLYVHRDDAKAFVRVFSRHVDQFVVGNGLRPDVTMGPLHSRAALDRSFGFLEDAARRGAVVKPLGTFSDEVESDGGHFLRPAIVTEIADDALLMSQEQFCPVIPIATYQTVDEAVARANDTQFGLSASVWGTDRIAAVQIASELEAGTVFVNGHGVGCIDRRMPYGGLKHSGQGRKAGLQGILEYCQSKVVTVVT